MPCFGNGEDHCCYVNGVACPHLEEFTVPDRRWACGLFRRLQDWDLVIASDSYQQDVAPYFGDMNCKDWPDGVGRNRGVCEICGVNSGN